VVSDRSVFLTLRRRDPDREFVVSSLRPVRPVLIRVACDKEFEEHHTLRLVRLRSFLYLTSFITGQEKFL